MGMKVGIRPGSGSSRVNQEEMAVLSRDKDGQGERFVQSQAWRRSALRLFRKHYGGNNHYRGVHELSYAGARRPFGTWHVQFSTTGNPCNLSEMFIVNVDEV